MLGKFKPKMQATLAVGILSPSLIFLVFPPLKPQMVATTLDTLHLGHTYSARPCSTTAKSNTTSNKLINTVVMGMNKNLSRHLRAK